jgi:ankyrin repeat protein
MYYVKWESSSQLDFGVRIPNPSTEPGRMSVFHCVAYSYCIPLIRRLVCLGYDINTVDSVGNTAVFKVVSDSRFRQRNYLSILHVLCEEGANVNFTVKPHTKDAHILYTLVRGNAHCTEAVELLLKHGASLSRALHAVTENESCSPFIKLLLDAGADIEEVWYNMTPLTRAASKNNPTIVQALLDAGANVNGDGNILPLFATLNPSLLRCTTNKSTQGAKNHLSE